MTPLIAPPFIARLNSRALIRVSGPDARPFLNNLLTQEVETLEPGQLRFGALLSPPGRLLFDLFIQGEADGVVLDVAADRREALMQRLSMYRLRAKVEIAAVEDGVFVAWGDGALADGFVVDPRLAALGGRRYGEVDAVNAGEADWQAYRLGLGVPDPTGDALIDKTYPIEANFDLLHGIDFNKGCFIGQETTSRMKRRGAIKNRMLGFVIEGDAPPQGAEVLLNGDRRAGEVMSADAGSGRGIALMRLDRLEGALTVDGVAIRVETPVWMD